MRTASILAAISFLFFITTAVSADVLVNIPNTSAYPNDTLHVPVNVSNLTGLGVYSYQFKINYDSKVVKAIGVDSARTLTEQWGMTWINLNVAGEIIVGNYSVDPLQNAGVLIYILFEMNGEIDDSTHLRFQNFEFNAGQPIAVTTNGSIKILHPPIAVTFKSNMIDVLKVLIDGSEKKLPFDTTWIYGSTHQIGAISPQYRTSAVRFVFDSWSDGGDATHLVAPVSDTVFTIKMKEQYLLTVNSERGKVSGGGWYHKGTSATFSVDAVVQESDTTRHAFARWIGQGTSSYSGPQRTTTIVMNDPVIESAEWKIQYILEIKSFYGTPTGVGWYDQGDTITIGIDSLVSPVEGTRHIFDSWIGKGEGSYSGKMRIAQVIMQKPIHERASWKTEYYLWIESNPEGIFDFKKSGWYTKNQTAITDTAKQLLNLPELICRFQRWSVEGQSIAGNPIQILMDTSHIAKALYRIDSVRVTITTNIGTETSIYVDGAEYPVPYSKFWAFQSAHLVGIDTMQYARDMRTRFLFESWNDNGLQSHVVQADTILQLTALLSTQHFLLVDTHPSGLIHFVESGWYDQGDTITISQVPEQIIVEPDTFNFRGWYLDNMPITGNHIHVIMDKYHSAIVLYQDLYFIRGKISDRKGHYVPTIAVILSGDLQDTVASSANSEYCLNFLIKGSYRVTPYSAGFRFGPPYRDYTSLQYSYSDQNFIAIDTLKPEIHLIYPNGGEQLKGAAMDTISWQAEDNMGIESIVISLSLDNGNTWQIIDVLDSTQETQYIWNIPDTSSSQCKIRITAIDYDGNHNFAVSESVFSIQTTSNITDDRISSLPIKFDVLQNYPNPFNSATALRFQLPEASRVSVRIFNIKGQEIILLYSGKLNRGNHHIKWDGKDHSGQLVSTGIYFYQVEALNKVITKRLLYLR